MCMCGNDKIIFIEVNFANFSANENIPAIFSHFQGENKVNMLKILENVTIKIDLL